MGFLEKVRLEKEKELKSLKIDGERKKPVLNPVSFLSERPVIAELKKASPTAGLISERDPLETALRYEEGGAGMISVLTERQFFSGSWELLGLVAEKVKLPILCKEFILSERQIDLAYILGADTVLLIAGFLSLSEAIRLSRYAKSLGLFVLLEIFDESHFGFIDHVEFDLLGVNSRNLEMLDVSLERAGRLLKALPEEAFKVAESGIKTEKDIVFLAGCGAKAFLIGETLMKASCPEDLIRRFTDVYKGVRDNIA